MFMSHRVMHDVPLNDNDDETNQYIVSMTQRKHYSIYIIYNIIQLLRAFSLVLCEYGLSSTS